MSHNVGDTVTLDGIECLIIYDNGSEAEWGRYIVTDKNHDLVYYFAGTDYENETLNNMDINIENKYGYEWGGYGTATGISNNNIGAGLTNTNSLIGMNLQPTTADWFVVWNKVSEFRSGRSDKWFVPSKDELNLIYINKDSLNGLTTINDENSSPYYRSSSEASPLYLYFAWLQTFNLGEQRNMAAKDSHAVRTRLCRYTTDSELDNLYEKKVWTTNEIITAIELNRIENRINELYSSYEPHEWSDGEIITSERLNSIETQLGTDKTWEDNEVITEDKLNDIEDALVSGSSKPTIYGFVINQNEPDPDARVTYIEDNKDYSPAYMDFESSQFNYGSWTLDEFFMPRPCMVKSDGTVDYYLNPNDYTKKEDGTDSDVANQSYDGNAMMEWGRNGKRIYYSFNPLDEEQSQVEVRISDEKVDDTYHDWSFYNKNNQEMDHFYTPIFQGGVVSNNKLRSLSGINSITSNTTPIDRTRAQNNGEGWDIEQYSDYVLVTLLLTLFCKSTNSQSKYGVSAYTPVIMSGTMNQNGMFYGENTNTASTKIKVFGMEYWWGSRGRRVLGYTINNYIPTFKLTPGTADGSTASDFNTTGSADGYLSVSGSIPSSSYYISKMRFESNGIMYPTATGGSSTTYYCDHIYFDSDSGSSGLIASFGRYYSGSFKSRTGAWCLGMLSNDIPISSANGVSLSLKPVLV